jgi:hypothetical protein
LPNAIPWRIEPSSPVIALADNLALAKIAQRRKQKRESLRADAAIDQAGGIKGRGGVVKRLFDIQDDRDGLVWMAAWAQDSAALATAAALSSRSRMVLRNSAIAGSRCSGVIGVVHVHGRTDALFASEVEWKVQATSA